MKMWFLEMFGICFASHDVFARQQQLPNCTLFQTVLHDDVFGEGFGEKHLFLDWRCFAECWNVHLQHMQMHVDEFIFVLLQLEFATNSGEQCACMHVPGSSMSHDRN